MSTRIVTRARLVRFWSAHLPAKGPMLAWEGLVKSATWTCPNDVKRTFRNADWAHSLWIFDVSRNRIIGDVQYQFTTPQGIVIPAVVYIKEVLTHPEYDKWSAAMNRK
ncbi:MAG TPA: type II toxin-antitoxin system HigB family toxin [Albitalea sp.]|uniref:type II toxin-antitoxin system HigB family toxin n=1 Tax=Piscinibacter sp. TaxID=1903157 RepID=UPI002ED18F13